VVVEVEAPETRLLVIKATEEAEVVPVPREELYISLRRSWSITASSLATVVRVALEGMAGTQVVPATTALVEGGVEEVAVQVGP
jgi:hypothetical protein